jgi:hypothetical protein
MKLEVLEFNTKELVWELVIKLDVFEFNTKELV